MGNTTLHENLFLELLETLLDKSERTRRDPGKSQLSASGQARGELGWRQSRKAHPQSYLQPQNLPVPFPGVYSRGPQGIMVLGQTSLQHIKNIPFPFAGAKQTLIYRGFLSGLPAVQIYRVSVLVRQKGLITQQLQLWPLGNTQSLDDLENLMGCLSSSCYTGSIERSYFNFSVSSFLQSVCTEGAVKILWCLFH